MSERNKPFFSVIIPVSHTCPHTFYKEKTFIQLNSKYLTLWLLTLIKMLMYKTLANFTHINYCNLMTDLQKLSTEITENGKEASMLEELENACFVIGWFLQQELQFHSQSKNKNPPTDTIVRPLLTNITVSLVHLCTQRFNTALPGQYSIQGAGVEHHTGRQSATVIRNVSAPRQAKE